MFILEMQKLEKLLGLSQRINDYSCQASHATHPIKTIKISMGIVV